MTAKHFRFLIGIAVLGYWASPASAVLLYSNDFSVNDSASWTVNTAPAGALQPQSAEFAFDYSVFGIPAAPGSSDTKGLRLRANVPPNTTRPNGTTSGLSVSPTGQNFGASYTVTFYAWSNFNGAANAQGLADNANSQGGTNNVMFGIGTSGTVPLVVGNPNLVGAPAAMDGIGFATTGDGGIANDYRAFLTSGTFAAPATGVYAAGVGATANQNTNAYYLAMGTLAPHAAPPVQLALSTAEFNDGAFNTQAGLTQAGSFGFAWHKVVLDKNGNTVTWSIDNTLIATVNAATLTLGGANIALGVSDVNATTTRHPSLLFTVFDNLTVTNTVPEATSVAVFGLIMSTAGLLLSRWREAV